MDLFIHICTFFSLSLALLLNQLASVHTSVCAYWTLKSHQQQIELKAHIARLVTSHIAGQQKKKTPLMIMLLEWRRDEIHIVIMSAPSMVFYAKLFFPFIFSISSLFFSLLLSLSLPFFTLIHGAYFIQVNTLYTPHKI